MGTIPNPIGRSAVESWIESGPPVRRFLQTGGEGGRERERGREGGDPAEGLAERSSSSPHLEVG